MCVIPAQVLTESSYAAAAKAIAVGLQTYAKRRHPYDRAADEMELAIYTHYAQQGRDLSNELKTEFEWKGHSRRGSSNVSSSSGRAESTVECSTSHLEEAEMQQDKQQHEEL